MDRNPWIPVSPHPQQRRFLLLTDILEVLFGGAAGGGKSAALLMAAAQYFGVPGYAALILRESIPDLDQPGALIPRSKEWWAGRAGWNAQKRRWSFPCEGGGWSTLTFGYLERDDDVFQYQSSEYQFIGIDELTQHSLFRYRYMFSRLRQPSTGMLGVVPLRMRAATNPGGKGHCVPSGKVLTPTGWKDIREFKVGDPVFAVNVDGQLIPSAVEQVHKSQYSGEMVHVSARGVSIRCTPNHRVAKVGGSRVGRRQRFTLTEFDKLPGQATVLRSVCWVGTQLETFTPPVHPTRPRRRTQPTSLHGNDYAELMGWFLSEGCTIDRDKAFDISQQKIANRSQILSLLRRCGFHYVLCGNVTIRIHAPDWWAHLRQFGTCREKYIPENLKAATRWQLRILFDALMAGDGHWQGKDSGQYYTTSKRLADDVAEVALKLGYVVYVTSRQRANRNGLSYAVQFKRTRSGGTELLTGNHLYKVATKTVRRSQITREQFTGDVYCIGVPDHHAFVIMQDGCAWVSGNSWVRRYYVKEETREPGVVFVPSKLADNPSLNAESYLRGLERLDPVTRAQLLAGDWDAIADGRFKRDWLRYYGRHGTGYMLGQRVVTDESVVDRFLTVDPAATVKETTKDDPDYTAISAWGKVGPDLLWLGCHRLRCEVPDILPAVNAMFLRHRAKRVYFRLSGPEVGVWQTAHRQATPLLNAMNLPGQGDKLQKATFMLNMAEAGHFWLPAPGAQPGFPLEDVEAELLRFTGDGRSHDDVWDTAGIAGTVAEQGPRTGQAPIWVR